MNQNVKLSTMGKLLNHDKKMNGYDLTTDLEDKIWVSHLMQTHHLNLILET